MKNVTLGQYIAGDSAMHRLDPRVKLLALIVYIVSLFAANNPVGLGISLAALVVFYIVAKIPIRMILRSIKPILPLIIFTAVINMFFVDGDPIFTVWKITLTKQGLYYAGMLAARILCLLAASSLLTYTTSPIELTDGIERLMRPLERLGLPIHEFAMMMTIALRFIPTLIEETDKIMSAQKARGADIDTGGLIKRIKALIPILIPLFVSSFRRADELALAMECRCYRGGRGRTRMSELKLARVDLIGAVIFTVISAGIITTKFFFKALY